MYNLSMALEISRLVHEERLLAAQQHRQASEFALANRVETVSPLQQMRKAMSRVMSLLF